MPKYLQQRRRRWYAVLDIPKSLRPRYGGKPRFVQSLETDSLSAAERRAPLLVAKWKAELEAVRSGNAQPLQDLRDVAAEWNAELDGAASDEQRLALEMILQDKAEELEGTRPGAGRPFFKLATGQWTETASLVEDWLATLDNEAKTIDMKRSDLARLSTRFRVLQKIDRKAVLQWVDHLHRAESLKLATVRRIISACRGYWAHLQRTHVVADDKEPFRDVVPRAARKSKSEVADKRRPFTDSDVVQLLHASLSDNDRSLASLIWMGMWTGCRIEELCALKASEVASDRFMIEDAKSEAGWREVPIHSSLNASLQSLCASSKDGFVLGGLTSNKYGDRSNAVGKRFGRLKTRLGYDHRLVFHSLRKTVTTQLDAAGVPEAVSARILGHDIPTMTYGLYSGGAPFETKRDALEVLKYPLRGDEEDALRATERALRAS